MATALAFAKLMDEHRSGLTSQEIGKHLELSGRHGHRLVLAAIEVGWPIVRDDEFRWKLAR